MNKIDATSVIAVCSLIAVLYGVIELSNYPLKRDIRKIEANQVKLEAGQSNLEKDMTEIKNELSQIRQLLVKPQPKPVQSKLSK